jgi:hypothetical protein
VRASYDRRVPGKAPEPVQLAESASSRDPNVRRGEAEQGAASSPVAAFQRLAAEIGNHAIASLAGGFAPGGTRMGAGRAAALSVARDDDGGTPAATVPPATTSSSALSSSPDTTTDATAQPAGSWTAPFDLGAQADTAGASAALVDIKAKLDEWKEVGFEAEMNLAYGAVDRALRSVSVANRALTADEATQLTAAGLIAHQAYVDALANFQAMIAAELDKYTGVDAMAGLDAIAEETHKAFMGGKDENNLAKAKEALEKAHSLGGEVEKYVGYAEKTKSFIKAAGKLTEIKQGLGEFNEKLETAGSIADLAESVLTLAGQLNQQPSEMQSDIGKFRATFKIIDFAISKSKVPVIGQIWEGYIKPCAEIAFKQLGKLDEMGDAQTRLSRVDEWWETAGKGMAAPSIEASGLEGIALATYFRGGQQMLDFMWSLFRGPDPDAVPSGVEAVFLQFRSQFNEGEDENDKIETDTKWYNPLTWFGQKHSPNLLDWVKKHKETVWSMLYGELTHP